MTVATGTSAVGIWIGDHIISAIIAEHLPWTRWILPLLVIVYGSVMLIGAQSRLLKDVRHRSMLRWSGLAGILIGESLFWIQSGRPVTTLSSLGLLLGILAAWRAHRLDRQFAVIAPDV